MVIEKEMETIVFEIIRPSISAEHENQIAAEYEHKIAQEEAIEQGCSNQDDISLESYIIEYRHALRKIHEKNALIKHKINRRVQKVLSPIQDEHLEEKSYNKVTYCAIFKERHKDLKKMRIDQEACQFLISRDLLL